MSRFRNVLTFFCFLIIFKTERVSSIELIACITVTTNVEDKVHFYLHTNQSRDAPHEVFLDDSNSLLNSTFDPALPIKFIVHGWDENASANVNVLLTNGYLDNGDFNIFVVDWGQIAKDPTYVIAKSYVDDVGLVVARFLEFISTVGEVSMSTFQLLGFSLGAHICGFAGKYVGSRVDLIVGMDPALPLFYDLLENKNCRLSDTDASYVLVIHTAVKTVGFDKNIGSADFYINYGYAIVLDVAASHHVSYRVMASSLYPENQYFGKNCGSYYQTVTDLRLCNGAGTQAKLGGIQIDTSIRGIYNVKVDTNILPRNLVLNEDIDSVILHNLAKSSSEVHNNLQ